MKRFVFLFGLVFALSGCSWLHHGDASEGTSSGGYLGGPDAGQGRGTTGVSSGATGGSGITGSDAAPPR